MCCPWAVTNPALLLPPCKLTNTTQHTTNHTQQQVGLLIGKPSVGSRDIVLAVVPHPDGEEVRLCVVLRCG